ncbi:MAG TPA: hypothetical protein VM737_02935 [Gemmatimonadota bacterium]|nr:hypothetical protein [Gemmatimonadota bacterium]
MILVTCMVSRSSAQDAGLVAAVAGFDPGLSLPDGGDLVHWADFNGDGRPDVAAILSGAGGSSLVIFNATNGGFQPHPLYTGLPSGVVELRLVLPGWQRVLGPKGSIDLPHPSLELVFPGRSSAIYAWSNGRYQVFPTENYF